MNNLTDPTIVEELYRASQAGAQIDLIVRAICTLVPGVEGAEREHPRPLGPRPLPRAQPALLLRGRRAEDVPPRQRRPDAAQSRPPDRGRRAGRGPARAQRARVDLQGAARRQPQAWELRADGSWERVAPKKNERRRSAQAAFMRRRDRRDAWRARTSAVMWGRHHGDMPVGVVDVGSNTVRLLVSRGGRRSAPSARCCASAPTSSARSIPSRQARADRDRRRRLRRAGARRGRRAARGADHEPGPAGGERRRAARRLEAAAGCPARILSAAEEGRLAFAGAIQRRSTAAAARRRRGRRRRRLGAARRRQPPRRAALHAIDRPRLAAADEPPPWRRSARCRAVRLARAEVDRYLAPLAPPPIRGCVRRRWQRPRRSSGCSERSSAPTSSSGRSTCSPTRQRARLRSPSGSTRSGPHAPRGRDHPGRLPAVARRAARRRSRRSQRRRAGGTGRAPRRRLTRPGATLPSVSRAELRVPPQHTRFEAHKCRASRRSGQAYVSPRGDGVTNRQRSGDGLADSPSAFAGGHAPFRQCAPSPSSRTGIRRPTRGSAPCSRRPGAPSGSRPGDVALGRLDVLPIARRRRARALGARPARGARRHRAERAPHARRRARQARDRRRAAAAGVPHPRTVHVAPWLELPELEPPLVLKPRFGSWGEDVIRCDDEDGDRARARAPATRARGSTRPAALAQKLVAPRGYDLRLVVAGGRVIGAVERVAAPGEWRTNVALGARREPCTRPTRTRDRARRRRGGRRRPRRRRPAAVGPRHVGRARGERRRRLQRRVLARRRCLRRGARSALGSRALVRVEPAA